MCRETCPNPSQCSLGLGGDWADGWEPSASTSLVGGGFPSVTVFATRSNSSKLAA